MSKDDPFLTDHHRPDADTKSVGLAVPVPLSSAELEAKYGPMRHGDLELGWPVPFEDAAGHIDVLSAHDLDSLKRIGVTAEEYYEIELSRAE